MNQSSYNGSLYDCPTQHITTFNRDRFEANGSVLGERGIWSKTAIYNSPIGITPTLSTPMDMVHYAEPISNSLVQGCQGKCQNKTAVVSKGKCITCNKEDPYETVVSSAPSYQPPAIPPRRRLAVEVVGNTMENTKTKRESESSNNMALCQKVATSIWPDSQKSDLLLSKIVNRTKSQMSHYSSGLKYSSGKDNLVTNLDIIGSCDEFIKSTRNKYFQEQLSATKSAYHRARTLLPTAPTYSMYLRTSSVQHKEHLTDEDEAHNRHRSSAIGRGEFPPKAKKSSTDSIDSFKLNEGSRFWVGRKQRLVQGHVYKKAIHPSCGLHSDDLALLTKMQNEIDRNWSATVQKLQQRKHINSLTEQRWERLSAQHVENIRDMSSLSRAKSNISYDPGRITATSNVVRGQKYTMIPTWGEIIKGRNRNRLLAPLRTRPIVKDEFLSDTTLSTIQRDPDRPSAASYDLTEKNRRYHAEPARYANRHNGDYGRSILNISPSQRSLSRKRAPAYKIIRDCTKVPENNNANEIIGELKKVVSQLRGELMSYRQKQRHVYIPATNDPESRMMPKTDKLTTTRRSNTRIKSRHKHHRHLNNSRDHHHDHHPHQTQPEDEGKIQHQHVHFSPNAVSDAVDNYEERQNKQQTIQKARISCQPTINVSKGKRCNSEHLRRGKPSPKLEKKPKSAISYSDLTSTTSKTDNNAGSYAENTIKSPGLDDIVEEPELKTIQREVPKKHSENQQLTTYESFETKVNKAETKNETILRKQHESATGLKRLKWKAGTLLRRLRCSDVFTAK